jgi:hypothetical protein
MVLESATGLQLTLEHRINIATTNITT